MRNSLFEMYIKKDECKIIIINKLSCSLWGHYWGIVSNYFKTVEFKNRCHLLTIDFSKCYWADPVALLSVLIELVYIKKEYGKRVKIGLPRLSANNQDNSNFLKGQFLKFLASQGFMRIMADNFALFDCREKEIGYKIEKYANYNYHLAYEGAEIVLAQIYDANINTKGQILKQVEEELLLRLKNTLSLQSYNMLVTQVYNILGELIENVEKHAYNDEQRSKLFGFYLRKRLGAINNYDKNIIKNERYSEFIKTEKENCPALDNQVLVENEAIIELFFVDIGMGLKGSLNDYYKNNLKKEYKYPIRELFYKVLKEGMRKNDINSLTPYGGLHFICRILKECNGYIWCNEGKEWVGSRSSDLLSQSSGNVIVKLTTNDVNLQNQGLAWCFRIPFNDSFIRKNSIAYTWKNKSKLHPVLRAYQTLERSLRINRTVCVDDQRGISLLMNGDPKDWIENLTETEVNIFGKADSFVWFPKKHMSKNQIITRTKNIIETIILKIASALDDINIIIGEIEANEYINFYYAFNNFSLNNLECSNVKRVILITNMWETMCFSPQEGNLYKDDDFTKRYYENDNINNSRPYDCISEYACFIRKYDSFLFWNFIEGNQKEKIYINADIKWNNNVVIRGYLNFERAYLYEDIYSLLKKVLKRTAGFAENTVVEYRNVDYDSARICQDINSNNIYNYANTICQINVGGACVTGYTRESFYNDNRVDINVFFFAHSFFQKDIDSTAFMLIWPQEDFFANFMQEQKTYYRLGKTSLITHNSEETLIDINRVYQNAIRNKKETYDDFQQKYPRFIKYGHYKTDRHHYLIGFDMLTYIKYSVLKKEGAFVYILWKIINYLADMNIEDIYNNLQDSEWKNILLKYNADNVDHGKLVVYHSNTSTEYILRYIKEILPSFLLSKLIPINIIETQQKGAPLTFSPFTLDYLKMQFNDRESHGILYIDSTFSTGRKMMEIENILLSTGCERVSFVSVFDMRRLRNEDVKNSSYWKVNIPRLDDDSHCVLCHTLKIVQNFSAKVSEDMATRIREWIVSWRCLSVVNTTSGFGIENVDDIQYNRDGISIGDTNALNIFVAEKLCESYSNDFVYKLINEKTDFSPNLKLQLICTQICLYGNQNSRQLQLSLLSALIENMAKNSSTNSYTSLAGLILISQPDVLIYELLNEILYINQDSRILSIKKYLLDTENIDLVIAIAYFAKNSYLVEQLLSGYEKRQRGRYKLISLINKHLLPEKDLKILSKEFEGILINEQGMRHNTNLQKLLSEHDVSVHDFKEKCQAVKTDIHRMYEIIKHFPIALANSCGEIIGIDNDIKDIINQIDILMMRDINMYEMQEQNIDEAQHKDKPGIQQFIISSELKDALINCNDIFESVLRSYFISYSNETINYFKLHIKRYEVKYNKKISLNIENRITRSNLHKWYYWNRNIETEFLYFIENLDHCFRNINDDDQQVQMIINISFELSYIVIKIKSWSKKLRI